MDVTNLSTQPLDLQLFPMGLRKHVDPKAPLPLRDMGAKGIAPGLTPPELVTVLYQLQFDEQVKETAQKSFADLPDELVQGALGGDLPAAVLDFCARRWLLRRDRVERLLRHKDIDDQTVAFIAGKCDDQLAEVISENQARLLRAPLIIAQLYQNPKAHQSTLDRILEFAHRQGITFEGMPALQKAVEANLLDARLQSHKQPDKAEDEAAAHIFQESAARAQVEEEHLSDEEFVQQMDLFRAILDGAEEAAAVDGDEKKKIVNRQTAILSMKISHKVRLATLGSGEDRAILIRDPNRLVHMAALLSPKTQPKDLRGYAGDKNLPEAIINYISNQRELTRDYNTMRSLLNNPKLMLSMGMRLMVNLRPNDLRMLARNRNVSPQLAKAAKSLADKRMTGRQN
jgi:hypothetical protein